MKIKALIAGLFAATLAMPALASEPAKTTWSGVWAGIHGGMDNSSSALGLGPLSLDGLSTNGMGYGISAGVDYQIPGTMLVVGIGGDYTWSDSEFTVNLAGLGTLFRAGIDESWAVYGRLGLDMGRVMPYILAGYTEADVSAGIPLIPGATAGTTLDGWLVGGGLEMKIAAGIVLGAEYRYSMFDTLTIGGPGGLKLDTDRHELRATLKYKANFF